MKEESGNENGKRKQVIRSYRDLEIYQRLYRVQIVVLTKIIPNLPKEEQFDLKDQMRRGCKSPPALVAEGFAKRYQQRSWRKYIEDTIGECNEMINHLSVCIDAYGNYINVNICKEAIEEYDIANKQLYRLHQSWRDFHKSF